MSVIHSKDRPIQRRGSTWPLLQKLVDHQNGAESITILVNEFEPGDLIRAHHHDVEEIVYVVNGTLVVTIGSERVEAQTGAAVIIPADKIHTLTNPGPGHLSSIGVLASAEAQTIWTDPHDISGLHLDQIATRNQK